MLLRMRAAEDEDETDVEGGRFAFKHVGRLELAVDLDEEVGVLPHHAPYSVPSSHTTRRDQDRAARQDARPYAQLRDVKHVAAYASICRG